MLDLEQHLKRQIAFSRATFGPGTRQKGVIDHIRKELVEVENSDGSPDEWVDVVILALDGLTRSFAAQGMNHDAAARKSVEEIVKKQNKNELRDWPDYRTAPADKAIEHVKVQGWPTPPQTVSPLPRTPFAVFRWHLTNMKIPPHLIPSMNNINVAIQRTCNEFDATPPDETRRQIMREVVCHTYEVARFRIGSPNIPISDETYEQLLREIADRFDLTRDEVLGYLQDD